MPAKMFLWFAITSFSFASANQYLIVDKTQLDVCNVLNTRSALVKLVSLLFNSDSLSGNTQASREAMTQPSVWARVNSLESNPSTESPRFVIKSYRDCDSIDRIIEMAMTIGAGFMSGELDKEELAQTVAELVNAHITTLDLEKLPITADDLYEQYHQRALNTPLLTILPSCEEPNFKWTDAANYDWRASVIDHGQQLYDDLAARLDHCNNCATSFVETLGAASGVEVSQELVDKILAGFKRRATDLLENLNSEDLPNSFGGILAYFINKQRSAPKLHSKPGEANAMIERIVTILDALNDEVVNGSGPMSLAFKDLYTSLGC